MGRKREALFVFSLYLVLSCAMTWPLVAGLTRDVPGDLGDSLLNMWILGWGAESVPRLLTGTATITGFANANIFHPEPLALAFSEHLFGQVLQILPLYHLTGNLILCYNLLVLSTFALSGFGMYLLVRELTGDRDAAFFAGLAFAFVPYRVAQISHIQSLSSQWMPLALYGFRRYITTTHQKALAGGTAALLMLNWSCGYYLIFFAPFVPLFVIHQIVANGRQREAKVWLMFAVAGAVVAAGTLPFLMLYLEAQRVHAFERSVAEIIRFSADVFSYLTAPEGLRVIGSLVQAWPKPEGELFLGFVPSALAIVGIVGAVTHARARDSSPASTPARANGGRFKAVPIVTFVLAVVAVALVAGLVGVLLTGGFVTSIAGLPLRATNPLRLLVQLTVVSAALLLLSRRLRQTTVNFLSSPAGLAVLSLVLALWLSLGPVARTRGQPIVGFGLYGVLLEYVPGFEGLRVPARYAMIAAVYLCVLAGIGAAWLMRRRLAAGAAARTLLAVLCVAFLVEAAFAPMPMNQTWGDGAIAPPPRVEPGANAPAVYRHLAATAENVVLAEFPFGDPAWELRYVYYSTVHWKRLLNGYSGGFPQAYKVRVARLQRYAEAPEEAWMTLREAGTTHVVVHEQALLPAETPALHAWLIAHGATEIGRFGDDVLYDLPHAP